MSNPFSYTLVIVILKFNILTAVRNSITGVIVSIGGPMLVSAGLVLV